MTFQGSLITEQGITFAIVIVKPHVLNNSIEANRLRNSFTSVFGNAPIILMAQNNSGVPTYYGKPDIVKFLANISPSRIPWKQYTIS